ncbi:MAG: recombination-associated protein RdgC [Candidatus Sumerlaeia bacterium]|nr:recombination-associated protein RdgC [Candidatus Sumerlaeia bacterium]
MPITHGSVSLREFLVEGELETGWEREAATMLSRYAFRPIAVEKGELRAAGWVNPRQVLDNDVSLDALRVGPWVLLALRQDRLALNARLFRAQRAIALAEAAAKAKKTRLTKNERQAVEEQVKLGMLKKQTPSTAIIEAAWHPERGVVHVAASSEAAAQIFAELFSVTFGLNLVPAVAAIRALKWAESAGCSDRLAELSPAVFALKERKGRLPARS